MTFRPSTTWEILRLRARLLARVRQYFDEHGFLEVETPILSADSVVDRHLDPFEIVLASDPCRPGQSRRLWLQTSPEFHMKRLLAAGSGPIYQVARVFRNGEAGPRHNPEFTMVEWYEPGVDYVTGIARLGDLAMELLRESTSKLFAGLPHPSPLPKGAGDKESLAAGLFFDTISYREAFRRYAEIDPFTATTDELFAATRQAGIVAPESLSPSDRDGWLDLLLVEQVEQRLGRERPTVLYDYPASQAALARLRTDADGITVAERFELYVAGIELANGYHELLDAAVLRERNRSANALRRADGKPALPEESQLLAAMEHGLPASVGVALGFDRVVMLAAGASTLGEVIAFPIERA